MYLSSVTIRGFRAGASRELTCTFPGRFSVLLGPNNAGKTTVCDGLYLAHHAQSKRHQGVNAGREALNLAGAEHQAVADELGLGRRFLERRQKKSGYTHGALLFCKALILTQFASSWA